MAMGNFIRCECICFDLDEPRPELFEALSGSVNTLYQWFLLDKDTFMQKALKPATVAHRGALRDTEVAHVFQGHLDRLTSEGLSSEEATTALLEKYYESLHRKRVFIEMASHGK
jgi:hypothetical protein